MLEIVNLMLEGMGKGIVLGLQVIQTSWKADATYQKLHVIAVRLVVLLVYKTQVKSSEYQRIIIEKEHVNG